MNSQFREVRQVFCDTSFFYAFLDHNEGHHARAVELGNEAATAGSVFISTWDVVSETLTLLRRRLGYRVAIRFLDEIKPTLHLVLYNHTVRQSAEEVFRRYTASRPLSFCDVVSFVVVTTMLDNIPCLSFDQDFLSLGLTVLQ